MDPKPGYKTTEFWLSTAALIAGVVLASGVIPTTGSWSQIVGIICALLAATGHTVSRTLVKTAAAPAPAPTPIPTPTPTP